MKFPSNMVLPGSIIALAVVALLIVSNVMAANIRSTMDDISSDVTALKADVGELKTGVGELATSVEELQGEVNNLKADVKSLATTTQVISEELSRGQSRFRQILAAIRNNEEGMVELHKKIAERSVVVVDAESAEVAEVAEELVQRCVFGAMMKWPNGTFTFIAPYYNGGQPPLSARMVYICNTEDGELAPYVSAAPEGAILDNPEALLWVLDPNSEPEPEIPVEADGTVFN